jgi:hypothetical protein
MSQKTGECQLCRTQVCKQRGAGQKVLPDAHIDRVCIDKTSAALQFQRLLRKIK